MPSTGSAKDKSVKKEDWLFAGLMQFAEGGERNVRVEKIARDLGVTKGSYYWYFKTREEFLDLMLEHSVVINTEDFILRAEEVSDPREKLRLLIVNVLKDRRGKDFDFYLRDFARRNAKAARIARRTDTRRMEYTAGLLEAMGVDADDARARAEIFYNYYLGWYKRNKDRELKRADLKRQLELLGRITGVDFE